MDLRDTFALNLRRMRNARGLSQEAMASSAGINRSYFSKIETSDTYVGLEIIAKLSEALEVEPAEFFRRPAKRSK
jgi:transcriptional regulator with XRE-family HTH domain